MHEEAPKAMHEIYLLINPIRENICGAKTSKLVPLRILRPTRSDIIKNVNN